MRLLLITERFAPDVGGVARSADRTAKTLTRLGVEVHVLALTRTLAPGTLESTEMEHGGGVIRVHRLGLFGKLDFSLQYATNVLDWLHGDHHFDAVWGHYLFPAGFLAVHFAGSIDVPVTVSARGNDVDRLTFPPGDFARLTWTIDGADVVSTVSQDLATKIDRLLRRPVNCQVVANSVDVETFAPGPPNQALREQLGCRPDEVVIGFCGELRQKKGFPFLLQALTHIRRDRPACFLVIGEARPREQTELATYALDHRDDVERILITGHLEHQSEVAEHLRLCDLTLQPSIWDGMPNAVLEALSTGVLTLASDAGGIPEVIRHDDNGFMVSKSELHRLGEAALEVLDLPDARKAEVRKAARDSIVDHFSGAREEAALRQVLQRLSKSSNA